MERNDSNNNLVELYFNSHLAKFHSSYMGFHQGKIVNFNEYKVLSVNDEFIHRQFRDLIINSYFPCVGAKSAIENNTYRLGIYNSFADPEVTEGLARDIERFKNKQHSFSSDFTSFIGIFKDSKINSEESFERLLWQQLSLLSRLDKQYYEWDPSVSSDPEDDNFAFSFAGRAFFLVGLNPFSSRIARRFTYPTLIFNAHFQFQALREKNKFHQIKSIIRCRDEKLQGYINPMVEDFGKISEAKQYSGRVVDENWSCPFRAEE